METTQLEALIGTLTVLGILAILVLPSVIGIARDRRIDRQIREAERARRDDTRRPARPRRQGFVTTTVTHHS